jgi:hypothetical protein
MLKLIEDEILRFLKSEDPEVLCIKGAWGVGKTYAWKKYLEEAETSGELGLGLYSYVSLFGLNSLDDVRFSIFERTVTGHHVVTGPDATTFKDLTAKGTELGRRARPIIDTLTSIFGWKGAGEALYKAAFLTVRKQLVCLDDLERAGKGLTVRDVLGLASFLKEERQCKIVLLLNDERMDEEGREEFSRQLEKVVDSTLVFDLSAEEACEIAFSAGTNVADLLNPRMVDLGINNIRVIKKIERLALQIRNILEGYDDGVIDQAMATLVLASWAVQQPGTAPSLDFVREYNRFSLAARAQRGDLDPDRQQWYDMLSLYPYVTMDDFDAVIIDGAVAGYFDKKRLTKEADQLQAALRQSGESSLGKAWSDLYHGSLVTEDVEFLDALYESSMSEAQVISPLNINSAIRVLREFGRGEQANDVVRNYVESRSEDGFEFYNIRNHHFSEDDIIDETFKVAMEEACQRHVDDRDPFEVLKSLARGGWSEADVILMGRQSADDFERMFEALRGPEVRASIETVLRIGRAGHAESENILQNATEALRRIARKSPLRARKIRRFGITE